MILEEQRLQLPGGDLSWFANESPEPSLAIRFTDSSSCWPKAVNADARVVPLRHHVQRDLRAGISAMPRCCVVLIGVSVGAPS